MIIYKKDSNIFDSTAHFIVNPVNTKGVMGKGLALEFKKKFKTNFDFYHEYCSKSSPKGGDLIWYYAKDLNDRNIINFCTKEDWKKPSNIEWIESGLRTLITQLRELYSEGSYPTPLLALPMLGCGEGGLNNKDVLDVFRKVLVDIKFDVEIYS